MTDVRKLAVGFYVPSENFKNMSEMTAVFFEDDMGLVATTGPANDAESEEYARLFAQAPQLKQVNELLIKTLEKAERQLNAIWLAEISNMKKYNQETARSNPLIFARIKDQNGFECYPTAAALMACRDALAKAKREPE